jgi:hypothetical protein
MEAENVQSDQVETGVIVYVEGPDIYMHFEHQTDGTERQQTEIIKELRQLIDNYWSPETRANLKLTWKKYRVYEEHILTENPRF